MKELVVDLCKRGKISFPDLVSAINTFTKFGENAKSYDDDLEWVVQKYLEIVPQSTKSFTGYIPYEPPAVKMIDKMDDYKPLGNPIKRESKIEKCIREASISELKHYSMEEIHNSVPPASEIFSNL